jgi:DNA-binding transcriptional MerR regulator
LREYERRGLVNPDRTDGGMRLYRDNDVAVARRVAELTAEGFSFAAVERVVRLEQRVAKLVGHIRVLEDQNLVLSDRLTKLARAGV